MQSINDDQGTHNLLIGHKSISIDQIREKYIQLNKQLSK